MCAIVKYCLFICLLFCAGYKGHAHIIDSLKTEAEVRQFLETALSQEGIIYLDECVSLSKAYRIRADSAGMDTIMAIDPVTDSMYVKVFKANFDPYEYVDSSIYSFTYPYHEAMAEINKHPLRFYKDDLDGNGRYDLVVDAGIVLIVLDKVTKFEGHMFSHRPNLYGFQNVIPLPHKSVGLVLRHDKRTCKDSANMQLYNASDTLIYGFNSFIKYHTHLKSGRIKKINYSFHSYMDEICMEINKDGKCYLRYRDYVTPFKKLSAVMDDSSLRQLWYFMANINVKDKIDGYYEMMTHTSGGEFNIYFEDGTVKQMFAYFCCPDIDLAYLSKYLSKLSQTLKWEFVDKQPADFECPCKRPDVEESNAELCDCIYSN